MTENQLYCLMQFQYQLASGLAELMLASGFKGTENSAKAFNQAHMLVADQHKRATLASQQPKTQWALINNDGVFYGPTPNGACDGKQYMLHGSPRTALLFTTRAAAEIYLREQNIWRLFQPIEVMPALEGEIR